MRRPYPYLFAGARTTFDPKEGRFSSALHKPRPLSFRRTASVGAKKAPFLGLMPRHHWRR